VDPLGDIMPEFAVGGVSGAAFTTFNPSVDGSSKEVCKNSIINCNIYGAKEYVWLNGGPSANGLGPDGEYFFAVLVPGGQPNPNDGGPKNLSDDFDEYTNRTFTVTGGEVSAYSGDHWLDSNTQAPDGCKNGNGPQACDGPDGKPPYIRLFPYADTWNPGGVYIMAICSLKDGYPVAPRQCKYDAFKVKEGQVTYDFLLDGYKIHDRDADGVLGGDDDEPIAKWKIYITGTGFLGEAIDATVETDDNGFWMYQSVQYTFNGQDKPQTAHLTVCEEHPADWVQSYPSPSCYTLDIDPEGVTYVSALNFGNYMPFDIKVCKLTDDYDESTLPVPYQGWEVYLYQDDVLFDTRYTGEDGCYTWKDLDPGYSYAVGEKDPPEWFSTDPYVDFGYVLSGDGDFFKQWINFPAQGCTPGFWQGGPDKPDAKAGGSLLWDGDDALPWGDQAEDAPHVDAQWTASGGADGNPYIHGTDFYGFFGGFNPGSYTMFELVDTGGGSENWRKAARSLVAAYLNASWGMSYAYSIAELESMWSSASANPDDSEVGFLALHTRLDAANNHFGNPDGECPISASGW